jgi:hypothetical protein
LLGSQINKSVCVALPSPIIDSYYNTWAGTLYQNDVITCQIYGDYTVGTAVLTAHGSSGSSVFIDIYEMDDMT